MYTINNRIRYSEVDSEKKINLSSLLDYLQDCCTFESEKLQIGVDYLAENRIAWVLSSWQLKILRYPKFNEIIRVSTWPYGFKGFYGWRNFAVEDERGERIVEANSVWIFMDTEKMCPKKITDEMIEAYRDEFAQPLGGEWEERKIKVPAAGEEKEPIRVPQYFIDTNHHMNNSKYVLTAQEYLPGEFIVKGLRAEYKKAAMSGDFLYPVVFGGQDNIMAALNDSDGNPCAVISFQR